MPTLPTSTSRSATLGGALGATAAGFVVVGVASAALGILPAFGGFLVMVLGLGLALVATVTSIVGLVATAPSKNRGGRSAALRGLVLALATVVALAIPASKGRGLPRINDITTNPEDPPTFVAAAADPANQGRDMAYPGEAFAAQQMEAYPDLATLVLEEDPAIAFDRVRAALAGMERMEITGEDREGGRLEATQTSALFHFADDVVVRIRPFEDGGSRIDVRSKSRDGKGDLGVNAARIRDLLARVRSNGPAPAGN
jgi:uncharacterized protein (DUF1499 family)